VPAAVDALAEGWAQDLMILFGCFFVLAAAIGLVRFPDFYTRLHAATKLVTLGGIGIFGGAAIAFAPAGASSRVLLIAVFFFLTAPLSGYMIARAGYLRGLAPYWEDTSVDEWKALGSTSSDLPAADDAAPPRWGGMEGPGAR
jgi:multicomponent Na+:H+ antiporter subunit G